MLCFHQKRNRSIGTLFVITCVYFTGVLYNLFETQCQVKLRERNENKSEVINNGTTKKNTTEPHKIKFIRRPICKHTFELIIVVISSASHFDDRTFIRNTWGNSTLGEQSKWKTFFLVAITTSDKKYLKSLNKEVDKFNDTIIGDTMDGLMPLQEFGFEWSITHCNFQYLLKADDNVFVNVFNLLDFLHSGETPKAKLYAGSVQFSAKVSRSGKFAVSKKEYSRRVYPKYCSNMCFVLSADAVIKMHKNLRNVAQLKIPDVYNGLLALASGINPMHNEMFRLTPTCSFNKDMITNVPTNELRCKKIFGDQYKIHRSGGTKI